MAPGYGFGYGYGAPVQAPYCEPPQEKVKYRYVPAGRQPDRAEGRKTDGTRRSMLLELLALLMDTSQAPTNDYGEARQRMRCSKRISWWR